VRESRDEELARAAGSALREQVQSSAAARARIMQLVRAEPRPLRGEGEIVDIAPRRRGLWRSPAVALLAAASIAGVVALVRARGVEGPIPEVPGHPSVNATTRAAAALPTAAPSRTLVPPGQVAVAHVQFVFVAPTARQVSVVGDFNDWDPQATPMVVAGGVWSREVEVPVGRHDYAFLVDGERWVADPSAPRAPADEFGSGYSVLVVGGER
jgi:hypothetical protein